MMSPFSCGRSFSDVNIFLNHFTHVCTKCTIQDYILRLPYRCFMACSVQMHDKARVCTHITHLGVHCDRDGFPENCVEGQGDDGGDESLNKFAPALPQAGHLPEAQGSPRRLRGAVAPDALLKHELLLLQASAACTFLCSSHRCCIHLMSSVPLVVLLLRRDSRLTHDCCCCSTGSCRRN